MEFPSLDTPVIIAMKGLPCTAKTVVATSIARWAKCPLLRIDDFLDELSEGGNYNGDSSPSGDEADRLHRLSFDVLCKVAACQLMMSTTFNCVVIKSRLCSRFELDQLIQLAGLQTHGRPHQLMIIECQIRNEYLWKHRFEGYSRTNKQWYKPKKLTDVKKAKHDYKARDWDRYFNESVKQLPPYNKFLISRLVLDPCEDLTEGDRFGIEMSRRFVDGIECLLAGNYMRQPTVELSQLQTFPGQPESNPPRNRSKYLCSDGACVFKYSRKLENSCGVCNDQQVSGEGYTCYFCSLDLHGSCAEMIDLPKVGYKFFRGMSSVPYLDEIDRLSTFESSYYDFQETYACNSCIQKKRSFSYQCKSCIFHTHLKCRLMPTIVFHDCHPEHFLSIRLASTIKEDVNYTCKGCGYSGYLNSYVCKMCSYNYHLRCVSLCAEVEHEHGGYQHRMKLMYSLDDDELEDFWCCVCYQDMDRELWFYSCQECDYVTHVDKLSRLPCGSPLPHKGWRSNI